jgi:hypothetical protein
MIELGLLGLLILVVVFSITLLRRSSDYPEEDMEGSTSTRNPPRNGNVNVPSASTA